MTFSTFLKIQGNFKLQRARAESTPLSCLQLKGKG